MMEHVETTWHCIQAECGLEMLPRSLVDLDPTVTLWHDHINFCDLT